jgi:hypothetical protein
VFFSLDDRNSAKTGYIPSKSNDWPEGMTNAFAASLNKLDALDQLYIAT